MITVKAKQHESYGTFTLLAILIPLVGFIVGIVYLTKEKAVDRKLGEHLIAISVLFTIIWWVVLSLFQTPTYAKMNVDVAHPSQSQLKAGDFYGYPVETSDPQPAGKNL